MQFVRLFFFNAQMRQVGFSCPYVSVHLDLSTLDSFAINGKKQTIQGMINLKVFISSLCTFLQIKKYVHTKYIFSVETPTLTFAQILETKCISVILSKS